MSIGKRLFRSYSFSLPVLFVGIISFVEASSPTLNKEIVASADTAGSLYSAQLFLFIVGAVCILLAIASLVSKFLSKS